MPSISHVTDAEQEEIRAVMLPCDRPCTVHLVSDVWSILSSTLVFQCTS